jgi:hypothetical protein
MEDIHVGDCLWWENPECPPYGRFVKVTRFVNPDRCHCWYPLNINISGEIEVLTKDLYRVPPDGHLVMMGDVFINFNVWRNSETDRYYIMFNDAAVKAWNESDVGGMLEKTHPVLTAFPTDYMGTWYGYQVRGRFVDTLKSLAQGDRVAYMLNQIFPWTVIEALAPRVYRAYKEKMDKKAAATAENELNRLAKIDKKEIKGMTTNKSASRFAREQRALQR